MSDETKRKKKGYYLLHIDGSNRARAIGALLKEPDGTPIPGAKLSEPIGPVTGPTMAEYQALLRGLELARERNINYVAVFSDSMIMVNQVNGLSNAGDNLAALRDEAQEALRSFKGRQVSWVPRSWNEEAHDLADNARARD
jgi:ribonuclease HI